MAVVKGTVNNWTQAWTQQPPRLSLSKREWSFPGSGNQGESLRGGGRVGGPGLSNRLLMTQELERERRRKR